MMIHYQFQLLPRSSRNSMYRRRVGITPPQLMLNVGCAHCADCAGEDGVCTMVEGAWEAEEARDEQETRTGTQRVL